MSQFLELGHLVNEFVNVGNIREGGESDLGEKWVGFGSGVGGCGWF